MKCPICNAENLPASLQCQTCSSPLLAMAALQDAPTIAPETRARPSGAHEQWPERDDDSYRVEELVGQGGMGAVWIVLDTRNGLRRCLKRPSRVSGSDLARFLGEIEILKGKLCGDIVPCIDYGRDRKGPFLIMPYYQRGSLQKRITEEGPLKGTAIFDLAKAIGRALCHLHMANVLHRDVKPANILLTDDGQPCLADFGLARTDEGGSTEAHGPVGTANYMAPEVSLGQPASAVSDIYSLGVTLRFAITGCPPGSGRDDAIPEPWRAVVLRCTEAAPAKRFQSAADFLATVDSLRFSSTVNAGAPCPDCGAETVAGASRCRKCDAQLSEPCGSCTSPVPRGTVTCSRCGANVPTWSQMRALREQAAGLVEEGQFARAAALLDKILEVLPAARGLTLTLREQIVRTSPVVSRLRRDARKLEFEQGPAAAAMIWRQVLGHCARDKEALDALQDIDARQVEFRFEVGAGEVKKACGELDVKAATLALELLQELADTPERTAACARLTRQVEAARQALLQTLAHSFAQALGTGNFPGALDLLARCEQEGMAVEQTTALRAQMAEVRRGVWRRDLAVGAGALLLAALGSLWFVKQMQASAESRVLAAFAADDHQLAIDEAMSMLLPTDLARSAADDARRLHGDEAAPTLPELAQMVLRWSSHQECAAMLDQRLERALRTRLALPSADAAVSTDDGLLRLSEPEGASLAVQLDGFALARREPGEFALPDELDDGVHRVSLQVHLDGVERSLPLLVQLRRAPLQLALLGAPPVTARVGDDVEISVEVLRARQPELTRLQITARDPETVSIRGPRPIATGRWRFAVAASTPGKVELTLRATDGPRQATMPFELTVAAPPQPTPPTRTWRLDGATPARTSAEALTLRAISNADEVTLVHGAGDARRTFTAEPDGSFRLVAQLDEGANRLRILARYGDDEVEQANWLTTRDSTGPRLRSPLPTSVRPESPITLQFDEVVTVLEPSGARASGDTVTLTAPSVAGGHTIDVLVEDQLGNPRPVRLQLSVLALTTIATVPAGQRPMSLCHTGRGVWAVGATSLLALGADAVASIAPLDIRHFHATGDRLAWIDGDQLLHFVASSTGPHRVCKVLMPDDVCLGVALDRDRVVLVTEQARDPGTWRVHTFDPHLQLHECQPLKWRPRAGDRLAELVMRDSLWALRTTNGSFLLNATRLAGNWNEEQNHWPTDGNGKRVEVAATAIAAGGPSDSLLLAAADGRVWLRVRRKYQVLTQLEQPLTSICGGQQRWIGTDGTNVCVLGRYDQGSTSRVELPGPARSVAFLGGPDDERAIAMLDDGRIVTFEP